MDKGRIKDLTTLMPWVGLFLFTPPVLFLFRQDTTIFGVPVLPVYLFVTWFALILTSRKLSEYLVDDTVPFDTPHMPPNSSDEA